MRRSMSRAGVCGSSVLVWLLGLAGYELATNTGLAFGSIACKTNEDCNDKNDCTEDHCNEKQVCEHAKTSGPCDDGNACTVEDACFEGSCIGSDLKCDDENVCTDDSCDPASGCVHANNSAKCEDGDKCTTEDACVEGVCQSGTALNCDDEKPCTYDACNPLLGCVHENHVGACDDGNACTVEDACFEGSCVGSDLKCDDEDVCTDDSCDPASGCVHANNSAKCEDGNKCTTADSCADGVCLGGPALDCADDKFCTDDSCDPKLGCVHQNHEGPCDDENPCTTLDHCSEGSCVAGEETECDDGLFCNGTEKCEPDVGCVGGEVPCPEGNTCDEESDRCLKCKGDAQCDDGFFCNGHETCNPDQGCQPGDKPCGEKACDEESDSCLGCASDDQCNDGLYCNGEEKCEPDGACHAGPEPCGIYACNEEEDACVVCSTDADCDDGQFCDGLERCVEGKCEHGNTPCPEELCDEEANACVPCGTPNSAFCIKVGVVDELSLWLGLEGKGTPLYGCGGLDEDLTQARGLILQSLGVDDPVSGLSGSLVIWGDSTHVDPVHGGFHGADVFEYEVEACARLDAYLAEGSKKGCPASALEGLKLALAAADRQLAETAIADASTAGGDSKQIAAAQALLAAADSAAKGGHICDTALETYEASWSTAVYSYAAGAKGATQALAFSSSARGTGIPGPWINISTADPLGYSSGNADLFRVFPVGSTVDFTAPSTYETQPFIGWHLNGLLQESDTTLTLVVGLGHVNLAVAYGACDTMLYGDVFPEGGNGMIDVDDLLYVLDGFADPNFCVTHPRADLYPCDGTCDEVDVDDLLAELDAFSGIYACPNLCR